MWPTSDRFTEVLNSGQRQWMTRVEVLYDTERIASLDSMVEGSVSMDDVAVRRALSMTLIDTTGELTPATARDLLAPKGTEVRVWRGLVVDGEPEWVPLGVFGITEPDVVAHDAGVRLRLRGYDRVDAVRVRRFAEPWAVALGTPTHQAITDIVTSRLPGVAMRVTTTGHTTPELLYDRLTDPWDAVREIARADSLTAFFDPLGTGIVTPELQQETGVVYEPGPASLMVEAGRRIDVDRTYSGVVVTNEDHPDVEPIHVELWDLDPASPTYSEGPFGRRPFGFASPIITTEAQALLAAQTLLPRVTRMRQTATLTTVGHPGHEVGDVITVIDPKTRTYGRWVVIGGRIPTRAGEIVLNLEEAVDA